MRRVEEKVDHPVVQVPVTEMKEEDRKNPEDENDDPEVTQELESKNQPMEAQVNVEEEGMEPHVSEDSSGELFSDNEVDSLGHVVDENDDDDKDDDFVLKDGDNNDDDSEVGKYDGDEKWQQQEEEANKVEEKEKENKKEEGR